MVSRHTWAAYPATYRAKEMAMLVEWIRLGTSGSVIGLAGSGKSNLLGFFCHRPDVLPGYLRSSLFTVVPLLIDLNTLPVVEQATLYRTILAAFYEARSRFDSLLQTKIVELYRENRAERDPFLPYSALRELFLRLQTQQVRVILVLDHFDNFCRMAEPHLLDTLRGLRDSFKDTLHYIVGLRREIAAQASPADLGELYELLDSHVCRVGALSEGDACFVIAQQTEAAPVPPTGPEINRLLELTGGYASLLKATCHWWLTRPDRPPVDQWLQTLLTDHRLRHRLEEIWTGLTDAERLILVETRRGATVAPKAERATARPEPDLQQHRLAELGLCHKKFGGWHIRSELLAAYLARMKQPETHAIWLDEKTGELFQDQTPLTGLSPLAREVLIFLIQHPFQRHTKTDLIVNAWPDELRRNGVTDDSLYQVVKELRKKIEPDPGQPRYLLTWRGRPEGGYQFFPEGRRRFA